MVADPNVREATAMARKIISIRLSEARAEHLRWLDLSQRLGVSTIANSRVVLNGLEKVVGNKLVRNIDRNDVDRYFTDCVVRHLQQGTVNLYTVRLGLFFDFCERRGYIDPMVMPMDGRKQKTLDPKPRARLAQEDFAALLDAAENPRDRMTLALGLYCFLRASEIRTLRLGDADLNGHEPSLQVIRHKTKKASVLPIAAELRAELQNYRAWYSAHVDAPLSPEWFLVPGNYHRRAEYDPEIRRLAPTGESKLTLLPHKMMWTHGPAYITQRALRTIGWDVQPGEGMHTLRRSGARELFDQLRDEHNFDDAMLTVMALLGHKKPDTTLVYLGIDREETRARKVLAGQTMFKRAAALRVVHGDVVTLRAVE